MNGRPDATWDKCLALIRENVSQQQYDTWFKPIVFVSYDAAHNTIQIGVQSAFVYEYLEENYASLLATVLTRCYGKGVKLQYRIIVDKKHRLSSIVEGGQTPQQEQTKSTARANQPPTPLDAAKPQHIDSQLNPRQTFSNYIEGSSNKLPRAVGLSIAEHPETTRFNPMFIFGPSGCGKTHLVNAIGMQTLQKYPSKRVLYVSARLFEVQYTNAVLQNRINDFISFYQTIDMLIVDDIQEWEEKKSTQNTFFHIFNHLFRNGRRIIFASDRPPVELKGINERLLTRFSCGLIAELEKPNPELCEEILRGKIRRDGLDFPDDVIHFLASTANGSIRDLYGAVNSLMAYSVVYNCSIDMQLAERVVSRAVKTDNKPLTVDEIVETVCHHYNVSPANVNSRSRKRDLVTARQVAMFLAQKYTKLTASRIGKLVGGRDHSTVIHSCAQVQQRMNSNPQFSKDIENIERSFKLKKQHP
ncbi:MAG: chromosomal replication initiator protein DnaA [Prevotella sp.]